MLTLTERIISSASDILAFIASIIAVYLFIFKRDKISLAFNYLANYSKQLTLAELISKIDRLNNINANDEKQKNEALNVLHEIEGQINGNNNLSTEFSIVLKKVRSYTSLRKEITEPCKRSLVSEIREKIRDTNVNNYKTVINKK